MELVERYTFCFYRFMKFEFFNIMHIYLFFLKDIFLYILLKNKSFGSFYLTRDNNDVSSAHKEKVIHLEICGFRFPPQQIFTYLTVIDKKAYVLVPFQSIRNQLYYRLVYSKKHLESFIYDVVSKFVLTTYLLFSLSTVIPVSVSLFLSPSPSFLSSKKLTPLVPFWHCY